MRRTFTDDEYKNVAEFYAESGHFDWLSHDKLMSWVRYAVGNEAQAMSQCPDFLTAEEYEKLKHSIISVIGELIVGSLN